MSSTDFNMEVVEQLKEEALERCGDVDCAVLHLAAALAGMCDSETEVVAVGKFAYRGIRLVENAYLGDNIVMFGDFH